MNMRWFLLSSLLAYGHAQTTACIPNSNNATELPTYYQSQRIEQLDSPHYFRAKLCTSYAVWGVYKSITVTVIVPGNPECNNLNDGCIFVELFNNGNYTNTPIATNYLVNNWVKEASTMFTIKYDAAKLVDSANYIYFRAWSGQNAALIASIRLEPSNQAPTQYHYDPSFFPKPNGKVVSQSLAQYTRLTTHQTIKDGERCLLALNFCVEDYENAPGIGIGVIAEDEYSTFNSYVCWNGAGGGPKGCYADGEAVTCTQEHSCFDESSQPFNNVNFPGTLNGKTKTNGNLLVAVVGQGGWPDLHNTFNFYAKLNPN